MNVHFITCFRMWSWDFARTRRALEFRSECFDGVCNEDPFSIGFARAEKSSFLPIKKLKFQKLTQVWEWNPIPASCSVQLGIGSRFQLLRISCSGRWIWITWNTLPQEMRNQIMVGLSDIFKRPFLWKPFNMGSDTGCNLAVVFKAEGVKHLVPYNVRIS